jgi:hypothetical protein
MQEIRSELPYDVDEARERVKQLSDWKYHMSRNSIPILITAAIAGYLLVPRKRAPKTLVVHREHASAAPAPAKRGLIGGIAGAAMTMLLRQAASIAANQLSNRFRTNFHTQQH